jgi:GNAT superfamily N-acetyltransferase
LKIVHRDEEHQIVYLDESPWGIIGGGIREYNAQQAGDDRAQQVSFVLQSSDQEIVGGVIGVLYWDWFSLELMWIQEEFRGRGYGHRLLTLAEEEARKRGAKHVHLDTFSFQAPDFYQRHGYEVFGELQDFPAGHQRYYMKKEL